VHESVLLERVNAKQCIDDKRKDDESGEHDVKPVEAREDPAKALEPPEQAFRLVAPPACFPVAFPGSAASLFRGAKGVKPG